jgi:pyridoxamine 5'-phosphate oxidase
MKSVAQIRQEYNQGLLDESLLSLSPFVLFENWLNVAIDKQVPEPNAMVLSTVDEGGYPMSRVVLLKDFNEQGFCFFTNLNSLKASQLKKCPYAALNFYWPLLERQMTITGSVECVENRQSDDYFAMRPRGAQIAAWASQQSEPVESRAILELRYAEKEQLFENQPNIPRPPHWGGFRLKPQRIEFWQGRPNRLHDRIAYTRDAEGSWNWVRLSP